MKLDTRGRFGSCSFCPSVALLKGEEVEGLDSIGLRDVGVGLRWSRLFDESSLPSLAAKASGDDSRYSLLTLMGLFCVLPPSTISRLSSRMGITAHCFVVGLLSAVVLD